jgi:subtilase family serine protease
VLAFFAVAISLNPGPPSTALPGQPSQSAVPVPPETSVHLGLSLRPTHQAEREALQRDLQNPSSPSYKHWLTPEEYGQRFGQSSQVYEQLAAWLGAAGLRVSRSPNRTFIEAYGKAASVEDLLHVQILQVDGQPRSVHVPSGEPDLPPSLAAAVLHVSGLDTRVRFHHLLRYSGNKQTLGPQDLRAFYGVQPLLDRGFVGQGQQLVVLSMAEPPGTGASTSDIEYFLRSISDARARFVTRTLPNPQGDFDMSPFGGGTEFDLDIETQSVGAPGADTLTLVVSPASEVFTTGPNDIVNNLPGATAVSISLGTCEPLEQQRTGNEAQTLRNLIIQGTMEGQTWSASSGDNGADDCRDGQTVAVDFPSSIPEVVATGGTDISGPAWDSNSALTAYQQEETWNSGVAGAGGGGISVIY